MPALVQTTHAVGWPGHDMRYAGGHLLLAARTAEGPIRASTAHPTDKPFAVAVELTPLDPADGSVQVELCPLVTSAMGSGHTSIIAGRAASGSMPSCGATGPFDYFAGATRSANTTRLSS